MGITILPPKNKVVERKPFALSHCLKVGGWLLQGFCSVCTAPEWPAEGAVTTEGSLSMDEESGTRKSPYRHSTKECAGVGCLIAPHWCWRPSLPDRGTACVRMRHKGCSLPSHKQMIFSSSLSNSVTIPTSSFPWGGRAAWFHWFSMPCLQLEGGRRPQPGH